MKQQKFKGARLDCVVLKNPIWFKVFEIIEPSHLQKLQYFPRLSTRETVHLFRHELDAVKDAIGIGKVIQAFNGLNGREIDSISAFDGQPVFGV